MDVRHHESRCAQRRRALHERGERAIVKPSKRVQEFCAASATQNSNFSNNMLGAFGNAAPAAGRGERLDRDGVADERRHHRDAAEEKERLCIGCGFAESEQIDERPTSRQGSAKHLGPNERRGAERGDDFLPGYLRRHNSGRGRLGHLLIRVFGAFESAKWHAGSSRQPRQIGLPGPEGGLRGVDIHFSQILEQDADDETVLS
jgi:hypothetical protein